MSGTPGRTSPPLGTAVPEISIVHDAHTAPGLPKRKSGCHVKRIKTARPHESHGLGRSPAWLGKGSQAAILLPLHPPSSSRRRAPASLPPARAGGAQAAQRRRSTSSLPSPCPARARGQRTPARQLEPRRPFPSPRGAPAAEPSAQFRRPRAGTEPGRRAAAAGFRSSRRPHTLLPFAASKQLAGALRAAPPSPCPGSAPPCARASRPPAPPPPTWSVSLSTAILPLLGAHTHTGPRSADVTPGAGEAEGIAKGREKNLAPEFDSPPPAPPPPPPSPPPPAERLTLASRVCSRARPPLYRKYRLLPAGPPLTSPRVASLAAAPPGPTLPPAARGRASQPAAQGAPRLPHRARHGRVRLPPAFRTCTLRAG